MQDEIDMKSFTGEIDQAAVGQSGSNFYLNEQQEAFPDVSPLSEEPARVDTEPTRQELNFKALRDEVDRIKNERESEKRQYQDQIDLLRANLAQRYEPQPAPREQRMFENMQDNDIPNVAELRREWENRENAYKLRLEELEVQATRPDYNEVIEKHTLPLIKEKPYLARVIQNADNKALTAYEFGNLARQASRPSAPEPQVNANAQRIIENSRKPGTLAQTGGQSVLSKADYYASMSDAEFIRMASKHLEGI